jgi:hypothetical protein
METPTGVSNQFQGVDGKTSVTLIGNEPGVDIYRIYDSYSGFTSRCYVALSSTGFVAMECP